LETNLRFRGKSGPDFKSDLTAFSKAIPKTNHEPKVRVLGMAHYVIAFYLNHVNLAPVFFEPGISAEAPNRMNFHTGPTPV
jgi:hypothetical protein